MYWLSSLKLHSDSNTATSSNKASAFTRAAAERPQFTRRRTEDNRDIRESLLLPSRVEIFKTRVTVVESIMPISSKKGGAFFGFNAMSTALHLALFCILIGIASHVFNE
jgi:hypothetical protein